MAFYNQGSGRSARNLADQRRRKINFALRGMFVLFGMFLLFVVGGGIQIGLGMIVVAFLFMQVMNYLLAQIKTHRKREKHALRGAEGEDDVADVLSELSNDYIILNDVETGHGDIDHVVISKQGAVFVIETKAHGGKVSFQNGDILINGRTPDKNFIGQVLHNAFVVRDDLKELVGKTVWINAVLCFTNAFVDYHAPIRGVQVLNKKFLLEYIRRNQPRRPMPEIWEKVRVR